MYSEINIDVGLKFYVYVYLDPRKPGKYVYGQYEFEHEPFYVGKGKDERLYQHLEEAYLGKDTNPFKCNKIRKIKNETNQDPIIIKYDEHLSEKDSFDLEIDMIKTIGRYNQKLGPLTNLTDGGAGGKTHEASLLERSVNGNRLKNLWKEKRHLLERNDEQNKQISIRTKDWWTEERKKERSLKYSGAGNSKAKYKYFLYRDGVLISEFLDLKQFCRVNNFPYRYVLETILKSRSYKDLLIKRELKIKEVLK